MTLRAPELFDLILRAAKRRELWDLVFWMESKAPVLIQALETMLAAPAFVHNPAPASEASRTGPRTWLFDAEGRRYSTVYRVLPLVSTDRAAGTAGAVLASNLPQSFRPSPGYPAEFQARDLSEHRRIAQLDPARLLVQHGDATLGAPVVWPGGQGQGQGPAAPVYYPLGGNSRTLALATADADAYQAYLSALRTDWPGLAPSGEPPPGTRWGLFRVAFQVSGEPLDLAGATRLAGASQAATAGAESVLGKATSVARGLGLGSLTDLPPITWTQSIHRENVKDFMRANGAFWRALAAKLDPARAQSVASRPDAAAELIRQVLSLALPAEVRQQGLGSRGEEEALLAALPALVTLHRKVTERLAKANWDLLPRLGMVAQGAREITRQKLGLGTALEAWEASKRQGGLFAGRAATIFDELDPLGLLFALALKQAASRADPEKAMEGYLAPYMAEALSDRQAAGQAGMFAAEPAGPSPEEVLAKVLGKAAAAWAGEAGEAGLGGPRENPRVPVPTRAALSPEARSLLRSLTRAAVVVRQDAQVPGELMQARLVQATEKRHSWESGYQVATMKLKITAAGRTMLERWDREDLRAAERAQGGMGW